MNKKFIYWILAGVGIGIFLTLLGFYLFLKYVVIYNGIEKFAEISHLSDLWRICIV